jgi:hypothetical protein
MGDAAANSNARALHSEVRRTGKQGLEQATLVCHNCRGRPAAGAKLKRCGGCLCQSYCSSACQNASWPTHKLACKTFAANRKRAQGGDGARSITKKDEIAAGNWYSTVPGLVAKVGFLAWKHRLESPIIQVRFTKIHTDPYLTSTS